MPAVNAFATDVAAGLAGPAALVARRTEAARSFAAAALPTDGEEVWRYSPIGELDLDRYRPAAPPADGVVPAEAQAILDLAAGVASIGLATVDGRLVHAAPLGGGTVDGLTAGSATDADVDLLDAHGAPADAFGLLADAFAEPIVIRVPAGAVVDPIVVVHWISGDGVAVFPRVA